MPCIHIFFKTTSGFLAEITEVKRPVFQLNSNNPVKIGVFSTQTKIPDYDDRFAERPPIKFKQFLNSYNKFGYFPISKFRIAFKLARIYINT